MVKTKIQLYSQIIMLDIQKVKPNSYNPNYMSPTKFDELKESIRGGFDQPIIIRENNEIIDGEHRWRALKQLGAKQIPCIIRADLTDDQAVLKTINQNRIRGFLTPRETGNVLSKLAKKIPVDVLAKKAIMPQRELMLLLNMKYDTKLDIEVVTDKGMSWAKIDSILNKLTQLIKTKKFDAILYTGRGGMVPARLMADRLSVNLIESLDQSYSTVKSGTYLFIDDIYDTGETHKRISKLVKGYDVTFAYLYERKGVKLPDRVFTGIETEGDEYVIFPWDKNEFRLSQKSNQ